MRITECSAKSSADIYAAAAGSAPIHIRVQGYRSFRVEGKPWRQEDGGYTMARVKWVDFELDDASTGPAGDVSEGLALGVQAGVDDDDIVVVGDEDEEAEENNKAERHRAISDSTAEAGRGEGDLASPELEGEAEEDQLALAIDSEALGPLVEDWCHLVRSGGHEKQDGQLDAVLSDLGPMPQASLPGARAVWVAALINPLPGLGVAWEIRPAMLAATSASERIEVAMAGIEASIQNLRASGASSAG